METLIYWLLVYRYIIILPIAVVEGPILALVCGFVVHLGYIELIPVFAILALADLISDIIWYHVGFFGGRPLILRFGRYFGANERTLPVAENLYHQHYIKILFISKITTGFGFAPAIVAAAGMARIPFWKYMLVNIVAQPIWTSAMLAVGYYAGYFYLSLFVRGLDILFLIPLLIIPAGLAYLAFCAVKNWIIRTYA